MAVEEATNNLLTEDLVAAAQPGSWFDIRSAAGGLPWLAQRTVTVHRVHSFCFLCLNEIVVSHEFGFITESPHLQEFPLCGPDEVRHADGCAVRGGQEGGVECDVFDAAPSQRELARQEGQIDVGV